MLGRLVRLIPEDNQGTNLERAALKTFFNYRLAGSSKDARLEWLDIVEARHSLWCGISSEKKELIRSLLNSVNLEIVKRTRPSSAFNFQSASVGNLFLTGARLFTGSFESAIYLVGAITGVPGNVSVIPAINSNFSHHICAGLEDGTSIAGQNAISHPSISTPIPSASERQTLNEISEHDYTEDACLPGSLPTLRKQYISFQKEQAEHLPSRIDRVWYINPYGQEIRPAPNPKVLEAISQSRCVIYSIGSLFTSIVPCLIPKDVGTVIASPTVRIKILILNGSIDRETGPLSSPFSCTDFISAIGEACHSSRDGCGHLGPRLWSDYITHVIHLEGEGTPSVDKDELKALGIEAHRIYGRKGVSGGMVYDGNALIQTLEAIIDRGEAKKRHSRRNTLQQ